MMKGGRPVIYMNKYILQFRKIQESKGIEYPPDKEAELFHKKYTKSLLPEPWTKEEERLLDYWKKKEEEWIIEEDKYIVECCLRERGYKAAEEYAFGQNRKKEIQDFFLKIQPCEYGQGCNIFCPKYNNCITKTKIDKEGD